MTRNNDDIGAQVIAAFDEDQFAKVTGLILATSLNSEVSSDDTAKLYWMAARSFYFEKDYSSVVKYSVKLIDYMIKEGHAIEGKELFEDTFNMTLNSYHQLKRHYSALKVIGRVKSSVGDHLPTMATAQKSILEDVAQVLYHRISIGVIALGVIIVVTVRSWPGITDPLSFAVGVCAVAMSVLVMLGKNVLVEMLKKILLAMTRS
ncbi:MAG: hypothetical protein WDO15_15080 [Bacteroidota bacterium]